MTTRIGLVGYGDGGRLFHTPYIQASNKCELVGVVARSAQSQAAVHSDLPDVAVVGSVAELLDLRPDVVVVSTPPETRREIVLEVVTSGVAAVADKPFAPSAEGGRALTSAAKENNVLLNVFHNRRWDADLVTARSVINSGRLGELRGLDLRLDLDEPDSVESGPEGGLLRDLGSHVVDQALNLMGPATRVFASLGQENRPEGETNVRFLIIIDHESGTQSRISASKVDHLSSKEIRIYGSEGSYVSDFNDLQADAVRAGKRPAGHRSSWGFEDEDRWGTLTTDDGTATVRAEQGDYTCYYDELADALDNGGRGPVPAEQGIQVLAVLDAVVRSAREGRTVDVER
ncbi:Gfo/Idh/MocA family oxidoreductase [Corynebacterium glyciniphilum]|uniref:Gfo/Idh/MocA family oxidoreductase n=1 Tax=Corynebacterium glyciniphilum TaxID=1404244 RepID=UPI003FD283AB